MGVRLDFNKLLRSIRLAGLRKMDEYKPCNCLKADRRAVMTKGDVLN